jgi:hypothetical protein
MDLLEQILTLDFILSRDVKPSALLRQDALCPGAALAYIRHIPVFPITGHTVVSYWSCFMIELLRRHPDPWLVAYLDLCNSVAPLQTKPKHSVSSQDIWTGEVAGGLVFDRPL